MIITDLTDSLTQISNQTKANLSILAVIVLIPWLVYVMNLLLNHRLFYLGIFPRRIVGLPGLFFTPLLHANFNHLFFNSIPLLVLSNFLLMHGLSYYLLVTLELTLLSGLLIWCFGKPGLHIGASAVITGYWGLLVSNIYHEGTMTAIILGIICLYYFAGIFYSVFPGKKGVSWEGHLFGLMAGFGIGYLSR